MKLNTEKYVRVSNVLSLLLDRSNCYSNSLLVSVYAWIVRIGRIIKPLTSMFRPGTFRVGRNLPIGRADPRTCYVTQLDGP